MSQFDLVVIGAGFSGAVIAERAASNFNKKVLVIEKRPHVGGNCYDFVNEKGILVHKYGPHIFHTNYKEVWDYLSNFTDWKLYQHRVLAYIDGKKVPLPFNLNTLRQLLPGAIRTPIEETLIKKFGYGQKIPILLLMEEKDEKLHFLADYIYQKVFLNYNRKQWGMKPEDLSPDVSGRVPILISHDDRYFWDKYQGIPESGYTKIFENLLSHPNIKLLLNTDYKEVINIDFAKKEIKLFGSAYDGKIVYTGPIDYFFDFKFGPLPYRSIDFRFYTFVPENPAAGTKENPYFQEVAVVNYPNDYDFTRITEFKHFNEHKSIFTTILKEFPQDYISGKNVPCYPILNQANKDTFTRYRDLAQDFSEKVKFVGRLAEYRYYNMDEVVKRALEISKTLFES